MAAISPGLTHRSCGVFQRRTRIRREGETVKYNRPQATASWGTKAKDWERGIDYQRLFNDRLKRAQDAVRHAGLGAVLCFNFDNIRYVTGTHIGEWARDKFMRYALCPVDGPALPLGSGAAGEAHLLALDRRQRRRADLHHAGCAAAVPRRRRPTSPSRSRRRSSTTASRRSRSASTSWSCRCCARSRPRASRSSTASRRCSTRARSRRRTRSSC